MWPFSKKKSAPLEGETADLEAAPAAASMAEESDDAPSSAVPEHESISGSGDSTSDGDPVAHTGAEAGETGPFDGATVDLEDFDFGDFAVSIVDLGSMRIPLPASTQIQVEMGEQGPRMLHIVSAQGRMTPVAFAAPNSGGQWESTLPELREGLQQQGLAVSLEQGPWGAEIVGTGNGVVLRVIGVDGPRWMLRFTAMAPTQHAEELATATREIMARTFVYRGEQAMLAGNALPVTLPQEIVQQIQSAMQQQMAQAQEGAGRHQRPASDAPASPAQDNSSRESSAPKHAAGDNE